VEEKNMRQQRVIKTTLGDLIAAVADEIMPIIRDPAGAYVVVSWVLNDVLTRQRVRDSKAARRKYQS
jgi:hypothetical protein